MNRVLWGSKSGMVAMRSFLDGQAEHDGIAVRAPASGSRKRIMAAAVAEPESVQRFDAGGESEVARMAVFTLQQSAARLRLLSAASTSAAVRARLSSLSAQSAQTARSFMHEHQDNPDRHSGNADVFRRDGDYWTISCRGTVVRLKHSRGMHYLWLLVAHPGHEFLALDLIARSCGDGMSGAPAAVRNQSLPILDPASKASYKRRLAELRETLPEAEAHNDIGRAESARAEIQFLEDEIAAGVGLGGRSRSMGSTAERARSTATKGVRGAIAKIGAAHPALGRHFDRAVRTGVYCVYDSDPDDQPNWQV